MSSSSPQQANQAYPAAAKEEEEEEPSTALHAAMKMADMIRSGIEQATVHQTSADTRTSTDTTYTTNTSTFPTSTTIEGIGNSSSSSSSNNKNDTPKADFRFTPGILEGTAVGVLAFLALTPVRSLAFRATADKHLGMLPDLIITTSQIMVSAQAALFYGSLYGSYHYLHTFHQIPPLAVSPTVDKICRQASSPAYLGLYQELARKNSTTNSSSSSSSSWNPSDIVLAEFAKAMKLCRTRAEFEQARQLTAKQEKEESGKTNNGTEKSKRWW